MQFNDAFKQKYFNPPAWARLMAQREAAPHSREEIRQAWSKLFEEAAALLDEDPAGEKAQDLARRWHELWQQCTFADPEIQAGHVRAWKDHRNWPPEAQDLIAKFDLEKVAPFISRATACQRLKQLKSYGELASRAFSRIPQPEPRSPDAWRNVLLPWLEILRDIEASLADDPAGENAQVLAKRWTDLWQSSMGNDRSIAADLKNALSAPEHWPAAAQEYVASFHFEAIRQFMRNAISCGMKKHYLDGSSMPAPSPAWIDLRNRIWRRAGLA